MTRYKKNTNSLRDLLVKSQVANISTCSLLTVLTIIALASRSVQANQQHEEELLRNPLVLDPNTLYDRTRMAASGNLIQTAPRFKRSTNKITPQESNQKVVDACQAKVELLTPYYATNSKGKLRSVVNSALMQQAIQVETCVRSSSGDRSKCNAQPDCGCEQKYKWHRLLVMDPSDSGASRGLFMDWFLYPSACVCRCKSSTKQFLRAAIKANST